MKSQTRAHQGLISVFAIIACAACEATTADTPPIGAVANLSSPATGSAGEPNLLSAPDGSVYVSWIELQPDSTHALRFAVLQGNELSSARTIASGSDWFVNWADFPMLARLDDGSLAAHWLQRSGPGKYSYDVMMTTSTDGGNTWSTAVKPHRDATESEHGFVSLFALGDRFGAVWLDGRKHAMKKSESEDGEMTVRYTTLARDGTLGDEIEVDGRACDCCQTAVANTSDGAVLVYRDRSADEIRDIYAARLVNGAWTAGAPVHADNWKVNYCPVNGPAVAANERSVAVAWFTAADSVPQVKLAFSADAGARFGVPVRVDDGNPAGRVDVQLLDNGDALVSWLERVRGQAELRVRRIDSKGKRGPAATVAQGSAERASGFPHIAISGDHVVFAWTEPGKPAKLRVATAPLQ
ncbi:MAG: sialidase family protein [Gemmatimonadota bacterium]